MTLTKNGQLRGCIGYVAPLKPLYLAVRDVAAMAALGTPVSARSPRKNWAICSTRSRCFPRCAASRTCRRSASARTDYLSTPATTRACFPSGGHRGKLGPGRRSWSRSATRPAFREYAGRVPTRSFPLHRPGFRRPRADGVFDSLQYGPIAGARLTIAINRAVLKKPNTGISQRLNRIAPMDEPARSRA